MNFHYVLLAALTTWQAAATNQGCGLIERQNCKPKNSVGAMLGCVWNRREGRCEDGQNPDDNRPAAKCEALTNRKQRCMSTRGCMYVDGQCLEGPCKLARDYPFDCKAAPFCAWQMPHGNKLWQDYHPKVRNECVNIDDRLGVGENYAKVDLNRFCAENKKRRDCLRPRYAAYPERLRIQLETDICFWNYNQEVCRVNREGAQYGNVVNATETSLPQENPDYIIVPTSEPPKNRDFIKQKGSGVGDGDSLWENYDEYNDMCLGLSDVEHVLGMGCEEKGCAIFFDESKFNLTSRTITDDAVYCVPRFPDTADFGVDPNNKFVEFSQGGTDKNRFDFLEYTDETIKEWIDYLLCDFVAPEYCNSITGCNPKVDPATKGNGVKSYVCSGTPSIGGKRRRIEPDSAGMVSDDEEEDDVPEEILEHLYSMLTDGVPNPIVDEPVEYEDSAEADSAEEAEVDPAGVTF